MKQYKVLKEMINAPVGTILSSDNGYGDLFALPYISAGDKITIHKCFIQNALDQKFIEPYTPEPKHWRAENREVYGIECEINGLKQVKSCETYARQDIYIYERIAELQTKKYNLISK